MGPQIHQEYALNEKGPEKQCRRCGDSIPANAPEGLCPKCLLLGVSELTEPVSFSGRPRPPGLAAVAAAFPQLEILGLIGQGGMGCVFKARQPQLDRIVALKILPEALATDPAFAARFAREARALAALNHPGIVTVHDFGESGGFYFLLMEYVDGVNLRQALQAGRFTPEQALAVVPPICEALQFAHERGIVHRDIKPENLLLDKHGRVKIADFGIAKMVEGNATAPHEPAFGSPTYAAPEQASLKADHRADIYSLGVVLYEMLTGEVPASKLEPPSSRVEVDVRLDQVVLRALEQSPELRWQTAAEFSTRLQEAATPRTSPPIAHSSARPLPIIALCLPSAIFAWFVVGGYDSLQIDLDADVLAWTSLIGFPFTAVLGLLLAWMARGNQPAPQPGSRWCPRALIAAALWFLSVLLMGGGIAMLKLLSQEPNWNPSGAELVFVLILAGGGVIAILAALVLGWSAGAQMSSHPGAWRGASAAFPAKWFWPGVAAGILLGLFSPGQGRRTAHVESARAAEVAQMAALNALVQLEAQPPVVIETEPVSGRTNVPPGEHTLRVRFSKPMTDHSWSWVHAWQNSAPEFLGEPRYLNSTTCALKVRLEPNRAYACWINSEEFEGFKDRHGRSAIPYLLIFETGPASVETGSDNNNERN